MAVWICFPELPFEYYEINVLKEIGKVIGPVLRIDANTASKTRGRYARICIQVDINKPLVRRILLEGVIQEFQNEGINYLCFSCGRIGHRLENCSYTVQATIPMHRPEEESAKGEGSDSGTSGSDSQKEGNRGGNVTEDFGPWMLVRRKRVGPKVGPALDADHLVMHGLGSNNIRSRDVHLPRANHYPSKSDSKSHRGLTDSKRKKDKQSLTAGALENDDLFAQGSFCGVADSPRDIPSSHVEDSSFSFAVGNSTTPCSSSLKVSEYRLPRGDTVRVQSTV